MNAVESLFKQILSTTAVNVRQASLRLLSDILQSMETFEGTVASLITYFEESHYESLLRKVIPFLLSKIQSVGNVTSNVSAARIGFLALLKR